MSNNMTLIHGEALEEMEKLEDKSVDLILTDPPYGTTSCSWDFVIDFELMWKQLHRIIKPNGAIVLFGSEPFSSLLRVSNLKNFKYDWVWEKSKSTGFLDCKRKPLKKHEIISVFCKGGRTLYNPQGLIKKKIATVSKGNRGRKSKGANGDVYGNADKDTLQEYENYPNSILGFNVDMKAKFHPTQKPVPLLEYLIKTYSNEKEVVLDFTMGSGSTGVACKNLKRNFIGIELDKNYFDIAEKRIKTTPERMF